MIAGNRAAALDYNDLGRLGWKYYSQIKKKAMEQEFSWSGLIISLSIAFFIVIAAAQGLSITYQSISLERQAARREKTFESQIKLDRLIKPQEEMKIA
jgi:hypothetical protein